VNIDADEAAVASRAKGEGGAGIISKNVEADGQFDCSANGATGGSHSSDRFWSNICFCKRNVTEVFHEKRVSASAFVRVGVSKGGGDYFFEVTLPARGAWQRLQVDDTD
jgi:hypothetical protein